MPSGTPEGPLVIDGLSLSLPPGQRIAIVGESGSGKPTLAALMLRFLTAEDGEILLEGTDVRRLNTDDLRTVVGLVSDGARIFA